MFHQLAIAIVLVLPWNPPQQTVHKREPSAAESPIRDVELSESGLVRGTVVDPLGEPAEGVTVAVAVNGDAREAVTDGDGRFLITDLTGGLCVVAVGERRWICRLWTHGTAPPSALKSIVVVLQDKPVVRGQFGGNAVAFEGSALSPVSSLGVGSVIGSTVAVGVVANTVLQTENASD